MGMVLQIVVGAVLNWAALMVVIPLAARIASFSFPGLKEAAGKLAVLVLVTNAISVTLSPQIGIGASILILIIFWTAMVKWFDVNFIGAVVIVVLNAIVNFFLGVLIGVALLSGA